MYDELEAERLLEENPGLSEDEACGLLRDCVDGITEDQAADLAAEYFANQTLDAYGRYVSG